MNQDHGHSPGARVADDARCQWLGLPARVDVLRELRAGLRRWAEDVGLPVDRAEEIVLCVDEAVCNAVEHAYAESTGTIDVVAVRTGSSAEVDVTVTDRGTWRKPSGRPGRRGRGLLIMRRLAERFDMDGGPLGTTVRMSWAASG
jgi:anti-sigma regulatory factor (Ser/Thr protein kinase)